MPNEICANCGKEIETKVTLGDGISWCSACGSVDAGELGMFIPSAYVPAALLEAVRKAVDGMDHGGCWCDMAIGNPMVKEHTDACKAMAGVRAMLDQIKGGEK